MHVHSQFKVLLVTVGRTPDAMRFSMKRFAFQDLYVIHTIHDDAADKNTRESLDLNLRYIHTNFPSAHLFPVNIYNFYHNVFLFRQIFSRYAGFPIACDITGGDKIVAIALIYARLLENERKNITIYYQRRGEDIMYEDERFIQLCNIPPLTHKQLQFFQYISGGETVDEMASKLDISVNNAWNYASALESYGLTRIDKDKRFIYSTLPFNFYQDPQKDEIIATKEAIISTINTNLTDLLPSIPNEMRIQIINKLNEIKILLGERNHDRNV